MKILILGAGQVGASLAAALVAENNDITVVDQDPQRLSELRERHDLRTVTGHASLPSVLAQAGAEDSDLMVAVTSQDEVNMVACQVADTLFRIPTRIARIRRVEYAQYPELMRRGGAAIDVVISPEQLVCEHVRRVIEYPGALQVVDFAEGRAQLVAVRAYGDGALVGHELKDLRRHMPPGVDARVAAIFRGGKAIIPRGDTVIQVDDEVFFLAARRDIMTVMAEWRRVEKPARRIMLAGGGNIGRALARSL
ncbi:MAG: Trk system potassium transporter TrkA, partial [Geminicoccaceae bacterium]|nr:Trk system potassium transporter TrkA [Geminicoccaceae bacterium]